MSNQFFNLWSNIIKSIPAWEWILGGAVILLAAILFVLYELFGKNRKSIYHAFEAIKVKKHELDESFKDLLYFEVTIPKDSQITAFQVQQKILKALHAIYQDPIEGPHVFSRHFYFFQKLYRWWKVSGSRV